MPRPANGTEVIKETCAFCDEAVWIPPGLYYRGDPAHKFCAKYQSQVDFGEEELDPFLDEIEDNLRELLPDVQSIP